MAFTYRLRLPLLALFLFSLALFCMFLPLVQAAPRPPSPSTAALPSPSPSALPPPVQRFPHNLHRLYDGTWQASGDSPFRFIPEKPHPSTPQASPESIQTPSPNLTSTRALVGTTHDEIKPTDALSLLSHFVKSASLTLSVYVKQLLDTTPGDSNENAASFQKKSGFSLLTIDNHKSALHTNLNVVFGDLILRDGAYRTPRDISLHLTGLYELSTGSLFIVGDIIYDSTTSALDRLYSAFVNQTKANQNAPDYRNITREVFVQSLTPKIEKYKNQFRMNRAYPAAAPPYSALGIAAQCPFTARFAITPGKYDDSVPIENSNLINGFTGMGMNSNSQGSLSSPSSLFDDKLAARGTVDNNGISIDSDRNPSGAPMFNSQDEIVEMKGEMVCETCKTKMSIVLSTLDTETLFGKAINYTLLVTIVAFIQVIVLIRQMEMTSTQAGARRISLMTVGLQAVADSYLCLGHLTMGIAVQTLFNAFATAAFFKFICFSIFLMRWMLLIWKARRPSGFSEGWEAMRRELSMLYSRFYGALLIGIFLLYQLQNHIRLFVFGLYSFWLPQIILNAIEDHRRPLLPVYIILTSVTRLAIPLYFWLCPYNFLHIQPQPVVALCLVCWMFVQCAMILSQYKLGPRWFIPKELLPKKYDYFRRITIENDEIIDLEAGSSNNGDSGNGDGADDGECAANSGGNDADVSRPLVSSNSNSNINNNGSSDQSNVTRECCICMESVNIHSRDRMVTPCNHFFHAACLERWLEVRLECALCRSPVPPP